MYYNDLIDGNAESSFLVSIAFVFELLLLAVTPMSGFFSVRVR